MVLEPSRPKLVRGQHVSIALVVNGVAILKDDMTKDMSRRQVIAIT